MPSTLLRTSCKHRVYAGPDGFLRIKLDDLPPGITPFDLYAPVAKADVSLALQRWSRVFSHWMEKDK